MEQILQLWYVVERSKTEAGLLSWVYLLKWASKLHADFRVVTSHTNIQSTFLSFNTKS